MTGTQIRITYLQAEDKYYLHKYRIHADKYTAHLPQFFPEGQALVFSSLAEVVEHLLPRK